MEFGIEKCAMPIMRRGKQQIREIIEIPNKEKTRIRGEKETYKYLRILEADTVKQMEMKKKNLRRTRKLQETNIYSKNLIKGINTWVVVLVTYMGPFFYRTIVELKQNGPENKKTNDDA